MKVEVRGLEKLAPKIQGPFNTAIKRLKKSCKLNKDLVIDIKKIEYHGWSWVSKGKCRIELKPSKCKHCMIDTLIHEWAHFMGQGKAPHPAEWGTHYAKCYRVVYR